MLLRFTIAGADGSARTVAVDKSEIRFGSGPENDVVLDADAPLQAFRVFFRDRDEVRVAPLESPPRTKRNGAPLYETALHPIDVIEVANHKISFTPSELSAARRARLVAAATLQKIAARFGDEASARFVDDLWRLYADGGPRLQARLYIEEPFAWVELLPGITPFDVPSFFWVHGGWQYLVGMDAFRQAIVQAQPDLSEWQPITRIYAHLVHASVLLTYEEAADYADPRWHLMVWSDEKLAAWEPPHFDGRALRFCVEDHRALECVTIWQDTFSVDVSRR